MPWRKTSKESRQSAEKGNWVERSILPVEKVKGQPGGYLRSTFRTETVVHVKVLMWEQACGV